MSIWGEIVVIGLGTLATILLAFGNTPKWAVVKTLAIIPTALITAVSSFLSFQDYRGEVIRSAKAQSDLAKIETEIEVELLKRSADGPAPYAVDGDKLLEWWKTEDSIAKGVDDQWLSSFSKPVSKNN